MDKEMIDQLLFEEESSTLDFKREQYKFINSNDEEKSKLLKDILAFANAWRRTDAYILIGVEEVKGGKSKVLGIETDIDDAQLQQFVNAKTNKPIAFSYTYVSYVDKLIGVIQIKKQKRPFYLSQDYGKIKKNVVHIRRGSASEIAEPNEIAEMGADNDSIVTRSPLLEAFWVCDEDDTELGKTIDANTVHLELPHREEIPKYGHDDKSYLSAAIQSSLSPTNYNYYFEFADYLKTHLATRKLRIGVRNKGNLVARDVNVELYFDQLNEVIIDKEYTLPSMPKKENSIAAGIISSTREFVHVPVTIKNMNNTARVSVEFGKLQTKSNRICSEPLVFQAVKSLELSALVSIFSDDLEEPVRDELKISIHSTKKTISVDELLEMADKAEE